MSETNTEQTQRNTVDIVKLEGKLDKLEVIVCESVKRVEAVVSHKDDNNQERHQEVMKKLDGTIDFLKLVNQKADEAREQAHKTREEVFEKVGTVDRKQVWMMGFAGGLGIAISKLIDIFTKK